MSWQVIYRGVLWLDTGPAVDERDDATQPWFSTASAWKRPEVIGTLVADPEAGYAVRSGDRPPLLIFLPSFRPTSDGGWRLVGADPFHVNCAPTDKPDGGWGVQCAWPLTIGEPVPSLTITPSINCVGSYHGFVTNGVITDDCEGRR